MNIDGQSSERDGDDESVRPFSINVEEVPLEGLGDVQSGNLTWRTLISGDRTPSDQLTLGVADFPPRGTLHVHRHDPAEFYFGLSGEGTVFAGGVSFRIAPGIAIFIPGSTDHGVIAGDRGLSIVYGFARRTFDDVIYDFQDGAPPHSLTSILDSVRKR
jgi:quercetin dioxygenase-like cupin family protein